MAGGQAKNLLAHTVVACFLRKKKEVQWLLFSQREAVAEERPTLVSLHSARACSIPVYI